MLWFLAVVRYLHKTTSNFLLFLVGESQMTPHEIQYVVPQIPPLSRTLFPIAVNVVLEGIETSFGKCSNVDDVVVTII